MKIEDLKAGRVYRAKRPRVVHTLGGSLGYQGGIFSGYRLKNPHKKPLDFTQVKV